MKKLKYITKITTEMLLYFIIASIISIYPLTIVINLPIMLIISGKILDTINENKIKDSIFSVSSEGEITQNILKNPKKILEALKTKNKEKFFITESIKMFIQLESNKIYKTTSHGKTYQLLEKMQKYGYVKNLKKLKLEKKSNLIFEKILLGNLKSLNKKHYMYNITFQTTSLKLNIKDSNILNLINNMDIDIKNDENGNITNVENIITNTDKQDIKVELNKKHGHTQSKREQIKALKQLKDDIQSKTDYTKYKKK